MALETRRSFNRKLLGSLMAYGLIETAFGRNLFADAVKPVVQKWLVELNALSKDLKDQKLKDVDFQAKLEDLYKNVDLAELIALMDLDKVAAGVKYPDLGAASLGVDLTKVEGLPEQLVFGKQIFACRKGRSIVPHGHDNMCTGFIVLRGDWNGKHYDRVEPTRRTTTSSSRRSTVRSSRASSPPSRTTRTTSTGSRRSRIRVSSSTSTSSATTRTTPTPPRGCTSIRWVRRRRTG